MTYCFKAIFLELHKFCEVVFIRLLHLNNEIERKMSFFKNFRSYL